MKVNQMKSILFAVLLCFYGNFSLAQDTQLFMFEQDGCHWCEIWNDQISEAYPKTIEGRTAPLKRINIHSKIPKSITLVSNPQFTPTFVVINVGKEIGRIEGYPGEDFFWGLLDKILLGLPNYVNVKGKS